MKMRLDQMLAERGMVPSRSQAESYIKLGEVVVNGKLVTKPGQLVRDDAEVVLNVKEQYVSRAALKLASVAKALQLEFKDKVMLDVGSSTGGFTDYALRHGAKKSIAVEVGTDQLHPSLRGNAQIELHEQMDIRNFKTKEVIDMVVADVSFIYLRDILPSVSELCTQKTDIVVMVKPQFEVNVDRSANLKHKGVIKNDRMRRDILKSFEDWARQYFITIDKADSDVAGAKGNQERFYKLRVL
jgi:23S rRNA (cytidine1920-2'-O)/16S rRNA (cytidine1409-2'-O)-methyltransferase